MFAWHTWRQKEKQWCCVVPLLIVNGYDKSIYKNKMKTVM